MPQSAYFVFKNIYFESHTISYIPLIIKFSVSLSLILSKLNHLNGLPRWLSGKESACQCKRHRSNPWVGKMPWSRKWQPTPVFLPGKLHGQWSLAGYSAWGRKELGTTVWWGAHTSVRGVCMQIWAKASLVRGGKGSERALSQCVDLKCLHPNHWMKCRNYAQPGQSHLSVGGVSASAFFLI